jgi:hypothetical protein
MTLKKLSQRGFVRSVLTAAGAVLQLACGTEDLSPAASG